MYRGMLLFLASALIHTFVRGVARNLFFWCIKKFRGGMKLQYSCSIAVLTSFLPHKKFTWTDFGGM